MRRRCAVAAKLRQADRVAVGLSEALKDYGTGFDVHISYSTDVRPGERPSEAIERAYKIVSRNLKTKFKQREGGLS